MKLVDPGKPMRRYAVCLLPLVLAGCSEGEPLAPAFAGKWVPYNFGCGGEARVAITKAGITTTDMPKGMPIGLTFKQVSVSGATAQVVIESKPLAGFVPSSPDPRNRYDLRDVEVLATLTASGERVTASGVLFRDKTTHQLRAGHPAVLALMYLRRC